MTRYPVSIARCDHIKTNGTQCGSPTLRDRRFCFFHNNRQARRIQPNLIPGDQGSRFNLPVLEDAKSIQSALMQVMRLILSHDIDAKSAGRLLYALQTATLNMHHTDLEPVTCEPSGIAPHFIKETDFGEYAVAPGGSDDDDDDIDPDEDDEESLDDEDEDDEDEEEDEDEDFDDDDENGDSNEPEDEEEDGPPLYVGNFPSGIITSPLKSTAARNN
jgi:hypothetical protein